MQSCLDYALNYINSYEKSFSSKEIQKAHEILSTCYRAKGKTQNINEKAMVAAYVSARMPATYAVMNTCIQMIPKNFTPESLLDIGAGPGTTAIAALDLWPELKLATLVEHHPCMNNFSKKLFDSFTANTTFDHIQKDIQTFSPSRNYDLVTLGYVLGELSQNQQSEILTKAWNATNRFLIITMPGTPDGYQILMFARNFLIEHKATVLAPCPHNQKCPLELTTDWCHFSVRLHRTKAHKHAKHGTLGYEDEKFSYLIMSKKELTQQPARILKKPIKKPGHVLIDLCTVEGINREIIPKSQKEIYKNSLKKNWGDKWSA
jgi:ribosomal protein RSM22 (predicted rRNA methylase)